MKKFFFIFFLWLIFCNNSFAESYYFKDCKLNDFVTADYIINFDKKVIDTTLRAADGAVQNFSDKIKKIEKKKIISERIKSQKGDDVYFQYFLDSKSKTVIKLEFIREAGVDIDVFKLKLKRESPCENIKANWNKQKIEEAEAAKEQEQVTKAQEKIKEEQSVLAKCQGNNHKKWTNCKGIYKTESGHKYEGLFIKGSILKGTSIYPGGAKYVGDFKDFKPHGYGTFAWTNGDRYFGEWQNGQANGRGTKIWKDGREYVGDFKKDKLHGEGTLFYKDGKKYVGGFINGKRHGEGTFTYSDGTAYIGKFIAGREDGLGQCVSKEGSSLPCKSKEETQKKDFSGKETLNISIVAKKWVRISQFESNTKKGKKIMDKLKKDFDAEASNLCVSKGNYNILEKKIEVLEIDETPAYGLETKLKLGISGVVECK